jgi:glycerol-3-phosphate O-acyltransferase
VYKNYLKRKQIEWKETAKEKEKKKKKKKKIKRVIFSLVWLYQPALEASAVEVVLKALFSLGPRSIPINRPGINSLS